MNMRFLNYFYCLNGTDMLNLVRLFTQFIIHTQEFQLNQNVKTIWI